MASELETLLAISREGHLNPAQRTQLERLLGERGMSYTTTTTATGSKLTPTGGGLIGASATDYVSLAQQMLKMQQEANLPALQSYEASVPETQAKFAGERTRLTAEKEPLAARYQSLLDEITRRESVDIAGQQRVTSREFGRRGIPLSSGIFESSLQELLSPIRQYWGGQFKQTGLERETAFRDLDNLISALTGQEVEAVRAIRNAIGQLQSGYSSEAIRNALSLYQMQQSEQARQQELALQQRLAEEQRAWQEKQLGWEQQQWEWQKPYQEQLWAKELEKPSSASTRPTQWQTQQTLQSQMLKDISRGATLSNIISTYGHAISLDDIVRLYSATSPYGPAEESWAQQYLTNW